MQKQVFNPAQLPDIEFVDQVFLLTIDPTLFDHEAHIRFAWLVLKEFEFDKAVVHIHDAIQGLDQKFGDGTKYHATITQALIEILRTRVKSQPEILTFEAFALVNQDLLKECKNVLLEHYSEELLFSNEARTQFMQPNRRRFY